MSQSYTLVGSRENLRCSAKDADALKTLWNECLEGQDEDGYEIESDGFDMELMDLKKGEKFGNLYIFADEFGDWGAIPEKVRVAIGEIVKKAGLPYLTFGFAIYNSRNLQDSQGGGEFRLYPDGTLVFPKTVYDGEEEKAD